VVSTSQVSLLHNLTVPAYTSDLSSLPLGALMKAQRALSHSRDTSNSDAEDSKANSDSEDDEMGGSQDEDRKGKRKARDPTDGSFRWNKEEYAARKKEIEKRASKHA